MNPAISTNINRTETELEDIKCVSSLESIIKQVLSSGKITRSQQKCCLTTMFSNYPLNSQQFSGIVEICNGLKTGTVRIIDET